jgi:hypothetical protein
MKGVSLFTGGLSEFKLTSIRVLEPSKLKIFQESKFARVFDIYAVKAEVVNEQKAKIFRSQTVICFHGEDLGKTI